MVWDLYSMQPIELQHPADVMIAVAAVSPVDGGVVWWNAEYMAACAAPMGLPGTGFAANLVLGRVEFHEESNTWRVFAENGAVYVFILPEKDLIAQWDSVKKTLPSIEALHRQASEIF